jgi:copper(I)-binding protein
MITQTSTQVAPVPGVNADVGQVGLRDVTIVYNGPAGYPAGADAPLVVRIFNNGSTPVTLVRVSAELATSVTLVGAAQVITPSQLPPVPTGTPAATPPPATQTGPTATTSPETSPTPSPQPPPSPTTPPPAAGPVSITIPPQSFVLLVPGEASSGFLQLNGLKQALVPGASTNVTFTFDDGSTTTLPVPLGPPGSPVPRGTPVVGTEPLQPGP